MREGYTSQAKKALAYAVRTAEKCGHNYVGTEHLLIGLPNVEDGTAVFADGRSEVLIS